MAQTAALPATAVGRNSERFFLGVERSATGRAWRDRLDERGQARALAIAQRPGVPELLARVLAGRGVEPDEVEAYLDPTVRRLMPDPHVLTDMAGGARAHRRRRDRAARSVAIFGDYDVDGATASALLARFLRHCGLDPIVHIPDRIFEGYGPNVEAIRSLRRARRNAARHRRLRHHQPRAARRGEEARPRRRRHRSSSGRRGAAAGRGHRQSEPRRRSLRPRPSRRRRSRVPHAGRAEPRAAPARFLDRRARPSPICCRCSIWSRSAPSPTWCRSTASTAPSSPRA